ncbi:RNA polymerase sigma factor [Chitinophaga sp. 180180018-2]|nr:RNA polymerase sigma factor [Chitinophaga sp. 212800010-3]
MENTSSYNERELLLRIADGDENAFRVLYDQYRKKIYSLGMFLTKSDILAQEMVQDVFMKIWEKRSQLQDIVYFNAWLRTIARNIALNYFRTLAMEKLGMTRLLACPQGDNRFTESDAADREYAQLMQAAINQLPPQQQKVYVLHRQQGLSHEIIARELGISLFTSKKYMKLALHSIRLFLENRINVTILIGLSFYLD